MFPGWDYILKRLDVRRPPLESADIHAPHPVDPRPATAAVDAHVEPLEQERTVGSKRPPRKSRQLICPACQSPMHIETMGKVEVDRCSNCGGIFLDSGELGLLRGEVAASFAPDDRDHSTLIYTPHGLE
ncbi:MAG: zf-TFIIB domain-containing protein [Spirochaetales bacterium]|nr:zf-TFIIB domain-containing protein [Spirochaetales bacterium]